MGIFKALGFGLFLLILKSIVPTVFIGGVSLITNIFTTLQSGLQKATLLINTLN
jgi:hypothetical protein